MKNDQSSSKGRRSLSDYICNPLSAFIWFFISGGFLILYVFVVLFFNKTRTDDSTQSNKDEGDSPSNYAPRTDSSLEDQGLRGLRNDGINVLSIKDMSSLTPQQPPQPVTSAVRALPTANTLQEQSIVVECKEEPTCYSEAVITTQEIACSCIAEDDKVIPPLLVFEEVGSDVQNDAAGDVSDEGMVHLHYDGLDAVEEMSTNHTQEPQHMTSAGCTLPTTDKLQEHSNVMACKEDGPTCSSVNTEACITENIILPSSPVLEELPSDVQSDACGRRPSRNPLTAIIYFFLSNGFLILYVIVMLLGNRRTNDGRDRTTQTRGSSVPRKSSNEDINTLRSKEMSDNHSLTQEPQHVICTLPTTKRLEQSIVMECKEEQTCSSEIVITTEDKVISDILSDVAGGVSDMGMVCLDSKMGAMETNNELLRYNGNEFDGNIINDDKTQTKDDENDSSNCEVPSTANDFDDRDPSVSMSPNNDAMNILSIMEMSTNQLFIQKPQCVTVASCTLPTTNKLQNQPIKMECEEVTICSSEAVITTEEIVSHCITEDDNVLVLKEEISDVQCDLAGDMSDVGKVCLEPVVDVEQADSAMLRYCSHLMFNENITNDDTTQTNKDNENYEIPKNILGDQGPSSSRNPSDDDTNVLSIKEMSTNHLFMQEPQHVTSAACTLPITKELHEHSTMMEKKEPTCFDDVVIKENEVISDILSDVAGDMPVVEKVCLDSGGLDAVEADDVLLGYNGNVFDGNITNDDTTQTNDEENVCNFDDQGSSVPKDLSDVATNALITKKMITNQLFIQEPQQVTSAACTLPTNKLEEQSIMMEYEEKPTCSSEAVITTEEIVSSCITEDDNVPVLEEVISGDMSVVGKVCLEADNELLGYYYLLNGSKLDENDYTTQTNDDEENDLSMYEMPRNPEEQCPRVRRDGSKHVLGTKELSTDHSHGVTSATYTMSTTNKQPTVMEYKEDEPACSSATSEVCLGEDIIFPSSVFDEDIQSNVAGDMSDVEMICLESEMGAVYEMQGHSNQYSGNMFDNITHYESVAEFETLYGQAFFDAGKADESIVHFKRGASHLGITVPSTKVGSALNLGYQAFKHFLYAKTPKLFQKKVYFDGVQYERAQCMGHLTKVYHHQQQNLLALMSSYQQLNAAKKCGDIDELMEAYASVIDCCQSYSLEKLSEHYVKEANKKSSELSVNENVHFVRTTMMMQLSKGNLVEAGQKGRTAMSIVRKNNTSLLLTTTIEYLSSELLMLNATAIQDCLDVICYIPRSDDKINAQITCVHFDLFLEIGIKAEDVEEMIETAEQYSIRKFLTGEDYYLATCLATWYARTRQWGLAKKYITIANSKKPTSYNFMTTKALCRQAECLLLLEASLDDKTICKQVTKTMKILKKKTKNCRVFAPRYLMLRSYQLLSQKKYRRAEDMLLQSIRGAKRMFNYFDACRAELSKLNWFPGRNDPPIMQSQQEFLIFPFP